MTTAQRNAMPTDELYAGDRIWNTTTNTLQVWTGVAWADVGSGGVADTFTHAGTTPYNVGGIPAGSGPYVLATIQDLFEELLYPYVHPTFSAFGLTGITVLEVGDSIDGAAQAITWTTTTPGNVAVNSIDIDDVTGAVNLETGLANSGTVNHDFSGAGAIVFNVAATNQFLITGTDTDPAGPSNFTRTFDVYWQWRKYVGDQAGAGNLAGAAIQALSIYNAVNTTCAGTYSFGAAATYKTFAFPALWVQPVSFKDLATGFNVPMEASYNVAAGGAMNNAFGQSPAGGYTVYRTTNIIGGAIDIVVV